MGKVFTEKRDLMTSTQAMIDFAHHEVHAGDHFFITSYVTRTAGEFLDICLTAPDTTKHAHMFLDFHGSTMTEVLLNEITTNSNNGTSVTPHNSYRASATTSGIVVVTGTGCCTNTGNNLMKWKVGLGTSPASKLGATGGTKRESEIIMKQGSGYLVRLIAVTTASNINYTLQWYEHTAGN